MGSTALNRFVASFVFPLVAGGRLEVRGLIGPGMLARFASDRQLDGTLVSSVMTHARAHLARLGPTGPMELLPIDAVALAAVWHNLLAMTHPEAVSRVRLRKTVRAWSARMLAWVGVPRTSTEVALRHALFARLRDVGRVDTDVSFWAGSAKYVGIAPPARLVAWPSVRRVQETRTRVSFFDLMLSLREDEPDANLLDAATTALALSPMTDISLADRPPPAAFAWTGAAINTLGDKALRGAMIRALLSRGAAPGGDKNAPPADPGVRATEAATLRALESALPPAGAQLLLRFHLELLATDALARAARPPGHELAWDALAKLGAERAVPIVGLDREHLESLLAMDRPGRAPARQSSSAPLLARAGYAEDPSS